MMTAEEAVAALDRSIKGLTTARDSINPEWWPAANKTNAYLTRVLADVASVYTITDVTQRENVKQWIADIEAKKKSE